MMSIMALYHDMYLPCLNQEMKEGAVMICMCSGYKCWPSFYNFSIKWIWNCSDNMIIIIFHFFFKLHFKMERLHIYNQYAIWNCMVLQYPVLDSNRHPVYDEVLLNLGWLPQCMFFSWIRSLVERIGLSAWSKSL